MQMFILVLLFLTLSLVASEDNCHHTDCQCERGSKVDGESGKESISVPCICEFSRKCLGEEDNAEATTAFTFVEMRSKPPICHISDPNITIPYGHQAIILNASGTVDTDTDSSDLRFLWRVRKSPYDPEEVPFDDYLLGREIRIGSSTLRSGIYVFDLWVSDMMSITHCSKFVTIEEEIKPERILFPDMRMDPDTLPVEFDWARYVKQMEEKKEEGDLDDKVQEFPPPPSLPELSFRDLIGNTENQAKPEGEHYVWNLDVKIVEKSVQPRPVCKENQIQEVPFASERFKLQSPCYDENDSGEPLRIVWYSVQKNGTVIQLDSDEVDCIGWESGDYEYEVDACNTFHCDLTDFKVRILAKESLEL